MRYTISILAGPYDILEVGKADTLTKARKLAGHFGAIYDHDLQRFVR